MDPWFSQAHEELRVRVRDFARREIAPVAAALDAESRFPWENVRKLADAGWFGINVPEEYGGFGLDYISYILVIEELARVDASHAITVSAHSTLGTSPILAFGTAEQKQRYLPLARARAGAGRVRSHGAGRRLRRRGHPHGRRARERQLPAQRQQDLHHARRRR